MKNICAHFLTVLSAVSILALASSVSADEPITQRITMTITGIDGAEVTLTRADLEGLKQISFSTATPWTDGVAQYSGPTMREVLSAYGIDGGIVQLGALNNYTVELDLSEITDEYPILATRIFGEPFPIQEKGPVWVLYPFDDNPELMNEHIFLTSVWQLTSIVQTSQ